MGGWISKITGSIGGAFGLGSGSGGGGSGGFDGGFFGREVDNNLPAPVEGQTEEDYRNSLAGLQRPGSQPPQGFDSNGNLLDRNTYNHGLRSHKALGGVGSASSNNPQDYRILEGGNAYDTAWSVANYQKDMQDNLYTPLLEDTAGQIGKSGLVDKARVSAFEQNVVGARMAERNRSRYGQKMSNAQRAHADRGIHRNAVLDHTRASNTARISEYEYDNGLRRGMINIGRGKLEAAAQGAGVATQSAAQREAAGSAAAAANQAQNTQTAAAAVGTALMIASMFVS